MGGGGVILWHLQGLLLEEDVKGGNDSHFGAIFVSKEQKEVQMKSRQWAYIVYFALLGGHLCHLTVGLCI